MARVNVFLKDKLLHEINAEAKDAGDQILAFAISL